MNDEPGTMNDEPGIRNLPNSKNRELRVDES